MIVIDSRGRIVSRYKLTKYKQVLMRRKVKSHKNKSRQPRKKKKSSVRRSRKVSSVKQKQAISLIQKRVAQTLHANRIGERKTITISDLVAENKRFESLISKKIAQTSQASIKTLPTDLPASYNQTQLVLMVRDPYWVYVYWDLSEDKKKEINLYSQEKEGAITTVLRIYDITNIPRDRSTSDELFDITIPLDVGQWYIYLGSPDHTFRADLGLRDADGSFYLITWSNEITMPRDAQSDIIDANWAILDGLCNDLLTPVSSSSTHIKMS